MNNLIKLFQNSVFGFVLSINYSSGTLEVETEDGEILEVTWFGRLLVTEGDRVRIIGRSELANNYTTKSVN